MSTGMSKFITIPLTTGKIAYVNPENITQISPGIVLGSIIVRVDGGTVETTLTSDEVLARIEAAK
jgi:hypothetical protein